MSILLITPTLTEFIPLQLGLGREIRSGQVRLRRCGIGLQKAAAFSKKLGVESWQGPIVLVGWAGGLYPGYAAGDMLLANKVYSLDGQQVPCTTLQLKGVHTGSILSAENILYSAQEKKEAYNATNALAVEMEAYPLAEWAANHSLPFVHGRVILDAFWETMPSFFNGKGSPERSPVQIHPVSLAFRMIKLSPTLVQLTRRILEAIPEEFHSVQA